MEHQELSQSKNRCQKVGSFFAYTLIPLFIISLVLILATILIPVLYGLLMVLTLLAIILLVLFTLGLIFLLENNPIIPMWEFVSTSSVESVMGVASICFDITPFVAGAGVLFSILSTALLFSSKQKCTGEKVVSILFGILNLLVLGFYFFIKATAI